MITFCPSCEAKGVVYRCDFPRDHSLSYPNPPTYSLLPFLSCHSLSLLGLFAKSHSPDIKSGSPLTVSLTHVRLGNTHGCNTKFFHSSLFRIYLKVTQHKVVFSGNDVHTHKDYCYISNEIILSFFKEISIAGIQCHFLKFFLVMVNLFHNNKSV